MKHRLPLLIKRLDFVRTGRSQGHLHATGIVLRSGAAECSLERRFVLRPGELYVIPAGAAHACFGAREEGTEAWGFSLPGAFNGISKRAPVVTLDERTREDMDSWLLRIEGEQQRNSVCSLAMRDALLKAVHIECARAVGVGACSGQTPLVVQALELIAADYAGPLRPRDIAARIGVSAAHLSHELKRLTGQSPSEWITQARIDAAKSLLLTSDAPVHRLAEIVGYSDVSQLNRYFRRLTGVPPEAWRRSNKARVPANEPLVAAE